MVWYLLMDFLLGFRIHADFCIFSDGLQSSTYGEELDAAVVGAANTPDVSSSKPSMLSMMGHAIKQVQEFERLRSQAPQYRPTPIAGRRRAGAPHKYVVHHAPEYKPTPLHVLKKASPAAPGAESGPVNDSTSEEPGLQWSKINQVTLGEAGKASTVKRRHRLESPVVDACVKKLKSSKSEGKVCDEDQEERKTPMEYEAVTGKADDSVNSNNTSSPRKSQPDSSQTESSGGGVNVFEKLNMLKSHVHDSVSHTTKETCTVYPIAKSCDREQAVESQQQTLDELKKDKEQSKDSEKENKSQSGERPDRKDQESQRSCSKHSKHLSSEKKASGHKHSHELKDSKNNAKSKEEGGISQTECRKSHLDKDRKKSSSVHKHKKSRSSHNRHRQTDSSCDKHGKHKGNKSHDKNNRENIIRTHKEYTFSSSFPAVFW